MNEKIKKSVMFCFSTANQTTNIIPIIQKKIDKVILFTTDYAKRFTESMIEVLKKREIDVENINIEKRIENNLTILKDFIYENVNRYRNYGKIYINIGGGTKNFTIAFYVTYLKLKDDESKLIYTDANSKEIIEIDRNLSEKRTDFEVDLTLDEILNLSGYTKNKSNATKDIMNIKKDDKKSHDDLLIGLYLSDYYIKSEIFRKVFLLYNNRNLFFENNIKNAVKKAIQKLKPEISDLRIKEDTYRKFETLMINKRFKEIKKYHLSGNLYEKYWNSVKSKIIEYVEKELDNIKDNVYNTPLLKNLKKEEISELKDIESTLYNRFNFNVVKFDIQESGVLRKKDIKFYIKDMGKVFENMVNSLFLKEINSDNVLKSKVNQVWINVTTARKGNTTGDSEYDLVIVTKFGTLILIEVKSAKVDGDTAKSKESGAYKKSGPYGRAAIINPDMDLLNDVNGEKFKWVPDYITGLRDIVKNQGVIHIKFNEIRNFLEKELLIK